MAHQIGSSIELCSVAAEIFPGFGNHPPALTKKNKELSQYRDGLQESQHISIRLENAWPV